MRSHHCFDVKRNERSREKVLITRYFCPWQQLEVKNRHFVIMTSLEGPNMTDMLQSVSGKNKVRKTSLPLASTRSFFVKKPPQAPLQQQGQDIVGFKSGSTLHDEEFLEEMAQMQGSQTEGVVLENTYRVAPDPVKKFSSGKLLVFVCTLSISL